MHRSSDEVAIQAIIFGTLGFRASLEVTEHPRSSEICSRLLPWLEQLNLGDHVEEFHREILNTPHGELPQEFETEAVWRGEAAYFLGWAIQLFDKPHHTMFIDPGVLTDDLRLLQPNVNELISSARLRPQKEIDDYCAFCLTVRNQVQFGAIQTKGQESLNRAYQLRLAELGLSEAFHRLKPSEVEAVISSSARDIRGLYVVRSLSAEWLLSKEE